MQRSTAQLCIARFEQLPNHPEPWAQTLLNPRVPSERLKAVDCRSCSYGCQRSLKFEHFGKHHPNLELHHFFAAFSLEVLHDLNLVRADVDTMRANIVFASATVGWAERDCKESVPSVP